MNTEKKQPVQPVPASSPAVLVKMVLLIAGLPLLCAVYGSWQLYRAFDPELSSGIHTVSVALACLVILCGLLGAFVGAWGLIAIRTLGVKARISRAALLGGFQAGMRKIPWLVGGVGFLVAGALAFALACEMLHLTVFAGASRRAWNVIVIGVAVSGTLLLFAFRLVLKIFLASRAVFEREPWTLMGRYVSEREAPAVWAFVCQVAKKAGAAMPDGIILGLDDDFFVTEHPLVLSSGAPVPRGRVLYLSLPYMLFMGKGEMAAVIGHELGHFTGADTEYSLHFAPIYAGAVRHLRAVADAAKDDSGLMKYVAKPAVMLGEFFLDSFHLAVQHRSRERELAADAMSASVADGDSMALALLRISALAPHVRRALRECWQKGGQSEGGVLALARELVRTHGLGNPEEYLEAVQSHPTDSHPTVRQRLAAAGVAITPEILERARDAGESGLLRELGIEFEAGTAPVQGVASLSTALESEFSRSAQGNAEALTEELTRQATQGREDVVFREGGILIFILWGIFALTGFAVFCFAEDWRMRCGALAAGLCLAVFMVWRYRLWTRPFLVLGMDGLYFSGWPEPLPWTALVDYSISIQSTSGITTVVTITLAVRDGHAMPGTRPDRRVRFVPAKSRIVLSVLNFRGRMNADTFGEILTLYRQGGLARARLRAMRHGEGDIFFAGGKHS